MKFWIALFLLCTTQAGYRLCAQDHGRAPVPQAATARHSQVNGEQAGSGVITDGDARFTVITPTLIRLEFSNNGKFIDRRSYFAWERATPPPAFRASRSSGVLTITTSHLRLTWKSGAREFNADTLSIQFLDRPGVWKTWHPGDKQTANLGGTLNSLDGASGAEPLPDGVVSRDGWYLHRDDSFLVSDGNQPRVEPRPASEIADWYFFGYGNNYYKTALDDLTTISGKIPIPPRFMLGAWRSRYYSYTGAGFKQLVREYDAHRFPLDVLVMDMGWHTTPHWGSVDWNKELIPHPEQLLDWLHQRHLHVTLNLHPNGGVGPWYSQYDEFARAMGLDPAQQKTIPFEDTNEKFMSNYYKLLLNPLEMQGVDFWWLDGGIHLGWDNAQNFWNIGRSSTGRRGASFSRWGGWGNQRYPVSFSGDTSSLWRVLRFEVPFTATAGNVGADYWSNDASGFRLKLPSSELFTRWVQFGALSPIFRTHGDNSFGNFRSPWKYGMRAEAASRRAYDLRAQLLPYLYTSAYLTWKTSQPLARPLYLENPGADEAYRHPEEYQLGPDLLVAPIVHRGLGRAWLGAAGMWFPQGTWWNLLTNERIRGDSNYPFLASADEIPVFVRGGVPLPMQPVKLRMTHAPANPLVIRIYPGPSSQFTLYEDDGRSPDYLRGAYSLTTLKYEKLATGTSEIIVEPAKGRYRGQPQTRRIEIELPVTARPTAVSVNGKTIPGSGTEFPSYTYHPGTATLAIRLPATSIHQQTTVQVRFHTSPQQDALLAQIVNRVAMTRRALAGAGQVQDAWRLSLVHLQFDLKTLLAETAESSPAAVPVLEAQWKADDQELEQIQAMLKTQQQQQAEAAAFALSDTYLGASVRSRKEKAGVTDSDQPRDRKRFSVPNNLSGFETGLLVRILRPAAADESTLGVHIPGLAEEELPLPPGKSSLFAFLPFLDATEHPLYHFTGTIDLGIHLGTAPLVVSRNVDVKHALLDQWNLVGPFDRGRIPVMGDTAITAAILGQSYPGKGGKPVSWQTWRHARSHQGYRGAANYLGGIKKWVDLRTIYPKDDASALAVTWIHAPRPMLVGVSIRATAGTSMWVNQLRVEGSAGNLGITDLTDPSPAASRMNLKQGWNQIVVETSSGAKDWGFSIRLHLPPGVVCAQSDRPPAPAGVTQP